MRKWGHHRHGHGFGGEHRHGERRGGRGGLGRILGHGDLRYVILALLEEKPRHGYDLIKALEEKSSGAYSPSPGTIYPTLTFLEEAGWATSTTEQNKKLYTITAEGTTWLDENREAVENLLKHFSTAGMGQAEAAEIVDQDRLSIRESMHALKTELFSFMEADKKTKQKIAEIIKKATSEIRKLKE